MFKIIGRYNQGRYEGSWEVIDTANSRVEIYYMLDEYILSFGNKWELEVLEE